MTKPTPHTSTEAGGPAVSRATAQTISDQVYADADAFASDLIANGADPQIAGNVVANILLRVAWAMAGSGKIMAGKGYPDVELFVEAARAATIGVQFILPDLEGDQ